jgi:Sap, sulfolipid-1-addressing protein
VSLEAVVLALASAVRPSTSLAALYSLLSTPQPRRPLVAFIAAGFTASVAVGVIVVAVFHGVDRPSRDSSVADVVDLLAGVAALGFALGVHSGQLRTRRDDGAPRDSSRISRSLRDPSARVAGTAGVVTHVPGLFYLVALTAIADGEPRFGQAVTEVAIYNAIWFSVPIAALVVAWRRPDVARALMRRTNAWGRQHQQPIVVILFAAVGGFLTIKGIVGLLD